MTYDPVDKRPSFKPGTKVTWHSFNNTYRGTIKQVFTEKVEREVNGERETQDADIMNPAYLIQNDDGQELLKRHQDVEMTRD